MKKSFHLLFDIIKVFILFTGCTILFYYGIVWVNQEYQNYHRYEEPNGSAVKVSTNQIEDGTWLDRLLFFYQHGE